MTGRRRARKAFRIAALAAIGAWLVRRARTRTPPPEGTWREAGPTDGWTTSRRG